MKKLILSAFIIGGIVASCSKKEAQPTTDQAYSTQVEKTDPTATVQNQVAIFEGTLACADCPGIETKLILNEADNTFTLDSKYLEKKDGEFASQGQYEVSEDGKFITLKEEGSTETTVYHVTDDALYMVTKVGDTELNENYKLSKK